ncbi:hypothetical protein C7H62_2266 [Mesoflavibacter sp. HG96]|uniref:DUF6452 family protein n=1 Tax=Mesoflavibacter profundi TaxID=2708110 RepID=A0ABT4RX87_9FLAO|nr:MULTISPECIES: DUF6452 family protein [Mesoflavibacter]MDA0176437.1 DUF6452 family protein [Mesoflavibacter profundi]QIJ90074.1 hypothetical protein C7H62_2266 [Mesoflavibacter sp. HG96]QIJ92802.1 hypothetical protein C7H56_2266 [Mesoflavibacter sp. HG37]
MKKIILLLLTFTILTTCERDDLCPESTPTTPSMIVDFKDNNIIENSKSVFNLIIIGVEDDSVFPLSTNVPEDSFLREFSGTDLNQISLPLKTDEDQTQFILIKEFEIDDNDTPDDFSDDFFTGNQELLTINYTREDLYVSRACGYKTIFKTININIDSGTDGPWIFQTIPQNDNLIIEDETITHYIFSH